MLSRLVRVRSDSVGNVGSSPLPRRADLCTSSRKSQKCQRLQQLQQRSPYSITSGVGGCSGASASLLIEVLGRLNACGRRDTFVTLTDAGVILINDDRP